MSTLPDDSALDAAAQWRVRQESTGFGDSERLAFERWLKAAPEHHAAWARVNGMLDGPLSTVRAFQARDDSAHVQAGMQALFRPSRRRVLRGALCIAGIGAAAGLVADRLTPLGGIMADLHTGTAERREFALAGGTSVLLDARSTVDVTDTSAFEQLHLRAGALMAVHSDAKPLRVRTRDGTVTLAVGRMMCRLQATGTEVVALEQALTLEPGNGRAVQLPQGEGMRFTAGSVERLAGNALDRAAWQQGMLAADDWPLAEVVEAVRAYFPGFIRVSPAAATLRVFGIFRLDVDEVLRSLVDTLPIEVSRLGPVITIGLDSLRSAR